MVAGVCFSAPGTGTFSSVGDLGTGADGAWSSRGGGCGDVSGSGRRACGGSSVGGGPRGMGEANLRIGRRRLSAQRRNRALFLVVVERWASRSASRGVCVGESYGRRKEVTTPTSCSDREVRLNSGAEIRKLNSHGGCGRTSSLQAQSTRGLQSWARLGFREGVRFGAAEQSRVLKVRAAEFDDAKQDPLGPGYWDGAEGAQKLNDMEDMKELIAEAEKLNKASRATDLSDELSREEIARRNAAKLREELAKRAQQQAEQRKQAETMFEMGQRAYGRGMYDKSVQLLEAALSNVSRATNLGGEIQIWLAMAYEADNRHDDCIALYKRLEASHPNKQIKRQAADLRYILEAPKLKISKEEMVSIPIIPPDYDRNEKTYSEKVRARRVKPMPKSKSKDYLEEWLVWDPPRWERNPYFWVALTVWLTLVAFSLIFQNQ